MKIVFEPGDIAEIDLPPEHEHSKWNGLKISITKFTTGLAQGTVVTPATPDHGYPVGSSLKWSAPDLLTPVTAKIQSKKDKYLSPFSGRWE